jgi:hypothetical protein
VQARLALARPGGDDVPVTSAPHPCRACGGPLTEHQDVRVRGELVTLHRCQSCGLFEFPEPTWLEAAYADPIADIDVGLPSRCVYLAGVIEAIVRSERLGARPHLDYGGGYGLLTRLCRDRGLDMRHYEPYAPNLFAQGFTAAPDQAYGCVTLVEVFEHLTDPLDVLRTLAGHTELVVISTQLVPAGMTDLSGWPYLIPDLGQHVTFYTPAALQALGERTGFRSTTDGFGLHVLSKRPLSRRTRAVLRRPRLAPVIANALRRRDHAPSLALTDVPIAMASLAERIDRTSR